jgi:DNA-binding CsgD family transcriptional regulator
MNFSISYYDLPKVEQEITELYASGLTKKEIASIRNRSIHTIGNQIKNIFTKTGTRKDTELSAWYFCTRYNIALNLPEYARRFVAGCLLALVGLSVYNDFSIIRPARTIRAARTARATRNKRNDNTFYLC